MTGLLLAGSAVVGILFAWLVWHGVSSAKSQLFCRSVAKGKGLRRSIALTFDDGPCPQTIQLLDYLQEQNIRATFFVCGANVLRHPEIVRALIDAGHELGNHTHTHRRLCPRLGWKLNVLSPAFVFSEFARAQGAIARATGTYPRLMRAPYGLRWFGLRRTQRLLHLLHVRWSVIAHDWEWNAQEVAAHVLQHAHAGAIICLHDGRDTRVAPDITVTLEAMRRIVPELKDRGFQFETVSDLLSADPR